MRHRAGSETFNRSDMNGTEATACKVALDCIQRAEERASELDEMLRGTPDIAARTLVTIDELRGWHREARAALNNP